MKIITNEKLYKIRCQCNCKFLFTENELHYNGKVQDDLIINNTIVICPRCENELNLYSYDYEVIK